MTIVVPNHFIEKNDKGIISIDDIFCLKYSTKIKNIKINVRTTAHCMIILQEGTKIIHLEDNDIKVNPQKILFLSQNNYFMSEIITESNRYKAILIYFDDKFIVEFIKKYNINMATNENKNIVKINYSNDLLYRSNVTLLTQYIEQKLDEKFLKLKIEEVILHSLRCDHSNTLSFLNSVISTSSNRINFLLESNIDLIQTVADMCKITKLTSSSLRTYMKKNITSTQKSGLIIND